MALILPKSVFFHLPKTGGNWVVEAIIRSGIPCHRDEPELKHPLNFQRAHISPDYIDTGDKFTFSFVRNPLGWYQSFWAYRMIDGWNSRFILDRVYRSEDFNEMVSVYLEKFPQGFVSWLYRDFLGENLEKVDFVGKQENLVDDLISALNQASEDFNEEAIRNTNKVNIAAQHTAWKAKCVYDPKVEERVKEVEKWTFEKFGYNKL